MNNKNGDIDEIMDLNLVRFIEGQIEYLEKIKGGFKGSQLGFIRINEILSEYLDVCLKLTRMISLLREKLEEARFDFDSWFSEKYLEVREEYNLPTLAAQKWLGAREIEAVVKKKYKEEYGRRSSRVFELQEKVSFLESILKQWDNYRQALTAISRNIQVEMTSLGVNPNTGGGF